jgi:hypothetical protein
MTTPDRTTFADLELGEWFDFTRGAHEEPVSVVYRKTGERTYEVVSMIDGEVFANGCVGVADNPVRRQVCVTHHGQAL